LKYHYGFLKTAWFVKASRKACISDNEAIIDTEIKNGDLLEICNAKET
jgi:uncharacterized ubiquitin-like protein YukD